MTAAAGSESACLNCGHALPPGTYCPHCGQREPHRLTLGHVAHEVLHVFTHADNTIVGFVPQVLLRPGRVVADYVAGRRKRYFNPFQFLLLAVGLVTVLATRLHYYDEVGASVKRRLMGRVSQEALLRVATYFEALGKYFNVWWLLLLPLHTLVVWAVYRRRGLNYAEAFLTQTIVNCAYQVYMLATLLFFALINLREPGASTALLGGLVAVVYLTLIGKQGLQLSWGGALWRGLLVGVVCGLLNYSLNVAAFTWYVFRR